jgi:hypothetical protein
MIPIGIVSIKSIFVVIALLFYLYQYFLLGKTLLIPQNTPKSFRVFVIDKTVSVAAKSSTEKLKQQR